MGAIIWRRETIFIPCQVYIFGPDGVHLCKQVNAVNLVYDCKMAFFWFAYAFVFGNLLGEENDNLSILNII